MVLKTFGLKPAAAFDGLKHFEKHFNVCKKILIDLSELIVTLLSGAQM